MLRNLGIFFLIISLISFFGGYFFWAKGGISDKVYAYVAIPSLLFIPAVILFIIAKSKRESEEEHADLRKAQLNALKKGNVDVELKSKIRKLK